MSRPLLATLALCLFPAGTTLADIVELADGRTLEGPALTREDKVIIAGESIGWDQIKRIQFTRAKNPRKAPVNIGGALPPGWRSIDIGPLLKRGTSRFDNDRFTLSAPGIDSVQRKERRIQDGFHFVFHPIEGDGELVAHIASLEPFGKYPSRKSRVGVIFRSTLGEHGVNVYSALNAQGLVNLRYYVDRGGSNARFKNEAHTAPCWLKIVRRGEVIHGYHSADGKTWREIGATRKIRNLPRTLYAGIAVVGYKEHTAKAVVEHLSLTGVQNRPPWTPRLVLHNGAILAWPFNAMDDTAVRFVQTPPGLTVSTVNVARVEFQPLDTVPKIPKHPGVLLRGGEFVEGTFTHLRDGQLHLSSPLLGHRTYDIAGEVAALLFAPPRPTHAVWEITLADSSKLRATGFHPTLQSLRIKAPLAGNPTFPLNEVTEIRRTR